MVSDDQPGFRLVLERTRTTIDVHPDETVLDAVARAGVEIDHRDDFLTDEEGPAATRCACASRAAPDPSSASTSSTDASCIKRVTVLLH